MTLPRSMPYSELFRFRRDRLSALLQLSQQQMGLIERDDYSELLAVLGRKQRLLGELDELNRRNPQWATLWRTDREQLAGDERAVCEQVLDETQALLAELTTCEQSSTAVLSQRRETTGRQLSAASHGPRVQRAYFDSERSPSAERPHLLDVGQ